MVVSIGYRLKDATLPGYPVEDYLKLFLLYYKNAFRKPFFPESDSSDSKESG